MVAAAELALVVKAVAVGGGRWERGAVPGTGIPTRGWSTGARPFMYEPSGLNWGAAASGAGVEGIAGFVRAAFGGDGISSRSLSWEKGCRPAAAAADGGAAAGAGGLEAAEAGRATVLI